jgi:hypothetical protein
MEPWSVLRLPLSATVLCAQDDLGLEAFAEVGFLRRQRVVRVPDAGGLGPDRRAVVRGGGLLGFCERPVEGGDGRGLARVLPGLDGELLRDVRDGDALVLQREGEGDRVVIDDFRPLARAWPY